MGYKDNLCKGHKTIGGFMHDASAAVAVNQDVGVCMASSKRIQQQFELLVVGRFLMISFLVGEPSQRTCRLAVHRDALHLYSQLPKLLLHDLPLQLLLLLCL